MIDLSIILLEAKVLSPYTTKGSALTALETDANFTTLGDLALLLQSSATEVTVYGSGTEYTTGDIVRYNGKLYEHIYVGSPPEITAIVPTNTTYWEEVTIGRLAHIKNQDTILDEGGANEVTAAELAPLAAGMVTKSFTKLLTPSEVKAAQATPIEVIASVAGKAIKIVDAWGELDFETGSPVGTAYSADASGSPIQLITNGADLPQVESAPKIIEADIKTAFNMPIVGLDSLAGLNYGAMLIEAAGVDFTIGGAAEVTAGDTPLRLSGYYIEIDLNI